MAVKSLAKSLGLVSLLVVSVHADSGSGSGSGSAGSGAGSAAAGSGSAAPAPVIEVKLTAPQMSDRVAATRTRVEADYQHAQHLATIARKQNDVIKLTCVNNKLVEMKAEMNILDTAYGSFTSQLGEGADAARASFLQVDDLGNKIHVLRGDADVCAGVVELTKQESGNTFTCGGDGNRCFPDDPTSWPAGGYSIEPPGYASPFN